LPARIPSVISVEENPVAEIGLSYQELQVEIGRRMANLDEAQEDEEHLGPFGDLMRMVAQTSFQRAADLIVLNNRRIARQLAAAGISLSTIAEPESSDERN
jgi:hypothetical protein